MLKYNEDFEGDSEDNDCMECAEDLNLNIKQNSRLQYHVSIIDTKQTAKQTIELQEYVN